MLPLLDDVLKAPAKPRALVLSWPDSCGMWGCWGVVSFSISKALREGRIDSLHIASAENKAFLFKSVGRKNV